MAGDNPQARGGLSLYANLLDPTGGSAGTISSASVSYRKPESSSEHYEAAKKQQALAASLRFQPTKRPQLAAQKAKAKAIASKFAKPPPAPAIATPPPPPDAESTPEPPVETAAPPPPPKSTLADWATVEDDDVNNFYGEKRQRGGRKKRKKNREAEEVVQDWDDIYDPSRPNNYEEYKNSEEKIKEVRDWKDLLYAHRIRRSGTNDYGSDESPSRPMNNQFAPPPMSFAPPSNSNEEQPPPPSVVPLPEVATGDDAFARRVAMSQQQTLPTQPLPAAVQPPPPSITQISRAPMRYSLPAAPTELPSTEAELEARLAAESPNPADSSDQLRSSRPGQAGFAQRLLSKYGWTAGSGLGASGTGIINPLYAKVDKRKKKPDSEGGGFVTPSSTGRILGGQKSQAAKDEEMGQFGPMSEVIRLEGMLNGMDLDEELQKEEGGVMQEIGEECDAKYGSVTRVYVHRHNADVEENGAMVFVSFVSQLSALRAVNALEGRVFGGNMIRARFWDREWFEEGNYE